MNRLIIACSFLFLLSSLSFTQADDLLDKDLASFNQRMKGIYELGEFRAKSIDARWLPDGSRYTITEMVGNRRKSVQYNLESDSLPESNRRPNTGRVSSDQRYIYRTRPNELFVIDTESDKEIQIAAHSPEQSISYRSIRWSPDGKFLAFVKSDSSKVRIRSMLTPGDPTYPTVRQMKFARVGGEIPQLAVGIANMKTGKTTWVSNKLLQGDCYIGQFEWAPDQNQVLIELQSRFRDRRDFVLVDAETGTAKTLYTESNAAWAISSRNKNSKLIWLDGGAKFIVISEKDGWRHARLYNREGREIRLLTPGNYDIIERGTVDEKNGWFYFIASPTDGTQKYLYRVPLGESKSAERITPEGQPGTHSYNFSPNGQYAFHTFSTYDRPPVIQLVKTSDHTVIRTLETNDDLRKKMQKLVRFPTEFFKLDISKGVSIDGWMIKPKDFDPSKKYPVFVYVYGEPYSQTVLDEWGTHHADFHRAIADLGYLVVSFDNRGTPAPKGAAWRRAVFGSLGPLSSDEQAAAVKKLGETYAFADLDRVGIWGWSGGGSNTLNALFRKPDTYHLGIAVVPKPRPELYNAWFQEIYMRTPAVNAEGYKKSAPIHFAEGLKGNLLIVTGSGETNTHVQIVEALVDRLIELGKPFDYMNYPNRDHGLRRGNGTAVHLRNLMARYLTTHLPRGGIQRKVEVK